MKNCIIAASEALGVSREQLSAAADVPMERLTSWETGEADPSLDEMVRVSATLQLPIDFLLCRSEPFGTVRL